jgi:hypothetical protein
MIWSHSHKGLICGEIVRDDGGEWVDVKLDFDHYPRMLAEGNQGTIWGAGETVTLRRSLLTEVKA